MKRPIIAAAAMAALAITLAGCTGTGGTGPANAPSGGSTRTIALAASFPNASIGDPF